MTAEILAAARGTLRDLDAALAAREAAAAVAWLDDVWAKIEGGTACGCGCGDEYEPRSVLIWSDDLDLVAYRAAVASGANHTRPMLEAFAPPGAYEDRDGEYVWEDVPGVDAARWPWPDPSHDIRIRGELAADMSPPAAARDGDRYVVVQRPDRPTVVYPADGAIVTRSQHAAAPSFDVSAGTPLGEAVERMVARAQTARRAVQQAAELEDALVRLRALLPPGELTPELLTALRGKLLELTEPARAACLRVLLDLIAAGHRTNWRLLLANPSLYAVQAAARQHLVPSIDFTYTGDGVVMAVDPVWAPGRDADLTIIDDPTRWPTTEETGP